MRHNDFENTPMLKLVMGLAIPSMIAQLVNIWLNRYIGDLLI